MAAFGWQEESLFSSANNFVVNSVYKYMTGKGPEVSLKSFFVFENLSETHPA